MLSFDVTLFVYCSIKISKLAFSLLHIVVACALLDDVLRPLVDQYNFAYWKKGEVLFSILLQSSEGKVASCEGVKGLFAFVSYPFQIRDC